MNSHQRRKQFRATKREFPLGTYVTLKYSSFFERGKLFMITRYSSLEPSHVLIKPLGSEKGWYTTTNNLIKTLP